ncbi:hypothetical protein BpHYR1_026944 [Brachionus plicatilis]|uniref:Uncharacterized protein n=1 Tax=Brachionus plicatilis TaxID=10195 RepID=A0A3M7P9C6_BRAPC|nr:hypothetical protein BpHYR1_026944 [Brachionus plicatilis]
MNKPNEIEKFRLCEILNLLNDQIFQICMLGGVRLAVSVGRLEKHFIKLSSYEIYGKQRKCLNECMSDANKSHLKSKTEIILNIFYSKTIKIKFQTIRSFSSFQNIFKI